MGRMGTEHDQGEGRKVKFERIVGWLLLFTPLLNLVILMEQCALWVWLEYGRDTTTVLRHPELGTKT